MADSKISALTDGTTPQDADQFAAARSTSDVKLTWSELRTALPGYQLDYVEITTNVSITATTAATANTVIDGNAVSYDGSTRVKLEFGATGASIPNTREIVVVLYDGATQLGQLLAQGNQGSTTTDCSGFYRAYFLTPTNASHTYHIKAYITGGTGTIYANNGAAGNPMPAWYRITKA